MPTFVIKNQKILLAEYNLSPRANAIALNYGVDALDDTVLGDDFHSNKPGLKTATFNVEGLYDPSTQYDQGLSSQLGLTEKPIGFANSSSVGSLAYFMPVAFSEYTPFQNTVGDLAGFSMSGAASRGRLVRGQVAYWVDNLSTSANGTAINLGAVSSSQTLYASVHVLAMQSTTHSILPVIQSDSSSGFSSPTTQITFSSFAAQGSSFSSVSGAVTDTWWRFSHTTATSSASTGISVAVLFGIY